MEKRTKPSLSIVNPLDVLRQRLVYQVDEDEEIYPRGHLPSKFMICFIVDSFHC